MLLLIFIFIVCFVLYVYSFVFRLIVDNPLQFFKYLPLDLSNYFRKYKYIPKKPFINVYCGLFGQGKTLSMVHDVIQFYNAYNDKIVYDDRFKKYVKQKVFVLSNVHINGIKYRKLSSLNQIVNIAKWRHKTDKKHNLRTITICAIDEASVQLNSRNFRETKDSKGNKVQANIDPMFLNALLTSRHALVHGFYLTSQRFEHIDALLRQVSTNVIECKKIWRFQKLSYYDAYEREHVSDPMKLKPKTIEGFFVKNSDYDSFDTLAVVENLAKSCSEGDMLPEKEIRENLMIQGRFNGENQKRKRRK